MNTLRINFKCWTKENWDGLNSKTQKKILGYYILCIIWIEESDNQSKVLIKLSLALTYNIYLKDWNMDHINKVAQTFGKISRGIVLWL